MFCRYSDRIVHHNIQHVNRKKLASKCFFGRPSWLTILLYCITRGKNFFTKSVFFAILCIYLSIVYMNNETKLANAETSKQDCEQRRQHKATCQSASDQILEHHLHSTLIATIFMAITLIFPIANQTSLRHTRTTRRKRKWREVSRMENNTTSK